MKTRTLVSICATTLVGLGMGATVALAGLNAGTGIVGSKHDMRRQSPEKYDRVCAYCHTPHHAIQDATADYLPLWAHQLTTLTYQPYASPTLVANITDPIAGPSRLCMSCHDGVIAVDQHYNISGSVVKTGDSFGQIAIANGTGDLTNDHPIGFNYADVAAQMANAIKPPSSQFLGNPNGTKISDNLVNGNMTCATCHEVHNKDNVADANNTYNYFLYAPESGSQICLSCHIK